MQRVAEPAPEESGPGWLDPDTGLGRAARALADAVSGLLGGTDDADGDRAGGAAPEGRRSTGRTSWKEPWKAYSPFASLCT
ncbi:hypothetical protein ACWKWC_19250, partial [Geodermatophilus nigrescens]